MVTHYVADFYFKWLISPLFFSMVFVEPGCELLKKFLALYLSYLTIVTERENPANCP